MAKNKIIHETTRKMSQLCRKVVHVNVRWGVLQRVSFVGHFFRFIWGRLVLCSVGKPAKYRRLPFGDSSPFPAATVEERFMQEHSTVMDSGYDTDSDLVNLKISLLGDCDIGKTTFVIKYVGNEQEKKSLQMEGLNLMDKTLFVEGARISCCIWDVAGDKRSLDQIPMACKDAVAVLIMFDLTSRSTLNNVVGWYSEARKWNKTAIPILIGTKFDDFVRLPPNLQWTIVTQARAYARAMNATLFFSSATHNINVNKIFKFIMAKLFNLPWKVERNLRVGEPIIDF
ncbi:PREDICTED: septum-promoting GTP-binding protein 1 isoform X2 [Lupinus angustifolius]|uniref:septum-promoting GTP-binding protein 1 isoform X1 n=1 Tax=Lupinus angustifolius TaxID=3871 RepID=UPI00092F3C79|nr:PREDICTED: septum-promoting GTP-binding protein 1 isoform X1 [Lupinus angustifolius]XP_019435452.1 PREDICTED: septum-promoting GTP-binding protein 1 isoform X2 [Lupinus angustifolius]